jgi:predicted metal-dependent phosphoesterase TrpH
MMLKGQLHTHTTLSDGTLTPQEVADVYASLGFDFLAFTDHDHLLRPADLRLVRQVTSPMLLFFGIELTVRCSKGYVHVNRIDGDRDALHIFNHPADYGLTLKKTMDCLKEVADLYALDAVEVTHHGFYTPQFDIDEIPYARVAADDSHNRLACGRGWIEVDCERSRDAIIAAIRGGNFRNHYAGGIYKREAAGLQWMQLA